MTTSNVHNAGIAHLGFTLGGRPFCGAHRAIMCTITAEASQWPRICVKCQGKWDAMTAKADRKRAAAPQAGCRS